ncbi:MAG: flagellar basal-body rod protein FlgF [Firmicutes bacterium]|nr:flagellar basal-body rod protein FlgF [Bacillota bacterium]
MLRGLYSATSGMVARSHWQDIIANNLANVTTPGFKGDLPVFESFPEMLLNRIMPDRGSMLDAVRKSTPIGRAGVGTVIAETATNFAEGPVVETGNKLDLALVGNGFFAVATPAGERYTRNGSFCLNEQGEIATLDGYRVLGEDGRPIQVAGAIHVVGSAGTVASRGANPGGSLGGNPGGRPPGPSGELTVREDGTVLVGATVVGRLRLVDFANRAALVKEGDNLFAAGPGAGPFPPPQAAIRQGFLEMPNVTPVKELVSMITCLRAYETNQKAIAFIDETLDRAVNEVGRV